MKRRVLQLLAIAVGLWLAIVITLFVMQRRMVFASQPAVEIGAISGGEVVTWGDGEQRGAAIWVPPAPGGPVVVHFHGNAEQLAGQVQMAELYGRRGLGFFAVEFPGYGVLAELAPSETALIANARAAIEHLTGKLGIARERIVLQGRSLGTGVAVALAASGIGTRMVLLSPFRSLAEVAAGHYPYVPVKLLLRDRFDSEARAPGVKIPCLLIHGDADTIIPFAHGRAMAETLPDAELLAVKGAGHNDLIALGGNRILGPMLAFALKSAAAP